jgi:hypothetical protein
LPGFFIELLTVAQPEKIPPHEPHRFSFGACNRDFLAGVGEGLSCLVLESRDPKADKVEFDQAGIGGFDLLDFARKGKRADGSETEVAFEIAFARDPMSPRAGFITCQHKRPENFWSPELQRHANGARAIAAAVFVAESPTDHHIFLETFSGVRDVHATSLGIKVATPRGNILVMERRGFLDAYGIEPPEGEGMRLTALVFDVTDLAATGAGLERNGAEARAHLGRLVIGPAAAHGATLVFSHNSA